jgi:hypothetical protein
MMRKLNCPHCGELGVSTLRKMLLGPGVPTECKVCGKKIGVPWISMIAVIPVLLAIFAAPLIEPRAYRIAMWAGVFAVMGIIWLYWVPLEPR